MATIRISVSARIDAPPKTLYDIIADYREGHPRILPRPPFVSLEVEEGGVGAGSVIRVQMRVMGRLDTFRATITEPDPGRVLVETNDNGYETTFTVIPEGGGERARVTLLTTKERRRGLLGALEARLAPRLLRPVYARELELLAAAAGAAGIRPVPG